MKKKIGILTFNNSNNYGAVLQAYATYKFLLDNGYEAKFINYQNDYECKNNKLFSYRKNLSLKKNIIIFVKNTMFLSSYYSYKSFKNFIEKMPKTKKIKANEFEKIKEFDVIVAGSDQIWNPSIYGGEIDQNFLLNFETNARKISYASSLGSYKISGENAQIYYEALNKFHSVATREDFAVKELEKIGIRNVKKVCDPTMLLTGERWEELIKESYKKITDENYLVVYLMSQYEEYQEQIKKIADFYNLKIVFVSFSNIKRKYVDYYAKGYSPFEFLSLIKNSNLVLTNSFHGTVFSLLFNKEFFNLENKKNPERVRSLLNQLDLNTRILKEDSLEKMQLEDIQKIDYKLVNKKVEEFANDSKKWFIENIGE